MTRAKRVLWISRHEMTEEQRRDLERVLDGPVTICPWKDTVQDMEELMSAVDWAEVIAAVLPTEKLPQLLELAGGRPVLQATSSRIPTGRTLTLNDGRREPEFAFAHAGWQQLLEVRVRTKKL